MQSVILCEEMIWVISEKGDEERVTELSIGGFYDLYNSPKKLRAD